MSSPFPFPSPSSPLSTPPIHPARTSFLASLPPSPALQPIAHKSASRHSLRSTSSRSSSLTLDRDGLVILEVGGGTGVVPIDLLQSLYLGRSPATPLRTPSPPRWSAPSTPQLPIRGTSTPPVPHTRSASSNSTSTPWSARSVSFTSTSTFPPVIKLPARERKRILVTGGAGFVGSHLVDRLMCSGHDVVVLDNFFSGSKSAISHWIGHPNFELVRADVVEPFMVEVDQIYHLACPASPKAYQHNAVKTLKTNFLGTMNMLGLAKRVKARFLLSSTSEIYGSPTEHPQSESYWGNVNCVGPRACYDEGKRVAEALTYGYHRQDGVDVRVARIFNAFGPRMNSSDGRLVSNFCVAALSGHPLEIYGTGLQTRSLMFIQDLIDGLISLMESEVVDPVNIGSEDEKTVEEWARVIRDTVEVMRSEGSLSPLPIPLCNEEEEEGEEERGEKGEGWKASEIVFKDAVVDDPPRRKPDISRARQVLGWEPKWTVESGMRETIMWYAAQGEED